MRIFWVLLIVGLAAPASGKWVVCGTGEDVRAPTNQVTRTGEQLCWDFTAAGDHSPAVTFMTSFGLLCFDPNINSAIVSGATVMPRRCLGGFKPSANPENQCIDLADADLDGTPGGPSTQNACIRVSGTVYGHTTTLPSGTARMIFTGE